MKNINIRKVKSEDAEQFIKLRNMVWRITYKDIFPEEVFLEKEARAEQEIKEFNQNFYNDNQVIAYVAVDDGRIVGLLWGKRNSEYEYFNNLGYADLMAMYIHPDYQGKGIGGQFKQKFINWAKENGAQKYVIGVLKDNKPARIVYEAWGGKLSKHTQPFVKIGVGYEEVFYTYDLK